MMITEGRTSPKVASSPPAIPVVLKPAKVAILIPIGPGVDSETAIISANSDAENQPYFSDKSNKKGSVTSPPPTANKPILKNSKNNKILYEQSKVYITAHGSRRYYKDGGIVEDVGQDIIQNPLYTISIS